MNWRPSDRLAAGVLSLLLWFLVAASALYWYFRVSGGAAPVSAPLASQAANATPDARHVLRAMGGQEAAPSATAAAPTPALAGRLVLRGIVTHGARGAALIGIDGQPPRPLRVGAALEGVEGGWTVRSVTPRAVLLGAGEQQLRLEMPPLAERSSAGDAVAAPPRPGAPVVPPRSVLPPALPPPSALPATGG